MDYIGINWWIRTRLQKTLLLLFVLFKSQIIHEGPTCQARCTGPCTSLQSKVRSCLSLLHEGASSVEGSEVLHKCCQFPERRGLPSQSRGPGEMLPTAERNVEKCGRGAGIALRRHYIHRIEENGWKVCRENHWNVAFPQWMPMTFSLSKVVSLGRTPVPSRRLHVRNLPSTIMIITVAYLPQEGAWFYLGSFLYLWCCIINQCFFPQH